MAKITPFQADLANRLVGTPGINPAAGKAASELAGKTEQLEGAVNSLANQQAGFEGSLMGSTIGEVARGAGELFAQHEAKVRTQQQALNKAHVAIAAYKAADAMDDQLNQAQQQHVNDPENIPSSVEDYIQQQKQPYLDQFTDPLLRAQAEEHYEEHANVIRNKARATSLDKQTKQLEAIPAQVTTKGLQAIANAPDGSPTTVMNEWQTNMHNGTLAIGRLAPQLGNNYTNAALDNHDRQLAKGAYTKMASDRPDDPVPSMQQIAQTRILLKGNLSINESLTPEDKKEIHASLDAAESSDARRLQQNLKIETASFMSASIRKAADLDVRRDDPEVQQKQIQASIKGLDALNVDKESILKDAQNFPAEVTAARLQANETQARELRSLIDLAQRHIDYKKAVDRQDAAEARRIQAEIQRNENEAKREAKAQLNAEATDAVADLRERRDNIRTLMTEDPIGNHDQIVQGLAEAHQKAYLINKAYPAKSSELTSTINLLDAAAMQYAKNFKRDWYDIGGQLQDYGTYFSSGLKDSAVSVQRKTQFVNDVRGLAQQMDDASKMEKTGAAINLTPRAQEMASKWFDSWQKTNPNATAAVKLQSQLTIQQYAAKQFPPPPSAKQLENAGQPHTLRTTKAPSTKGFVSPPKVAQDSNNGE
ncbi:MAG TPA: hypothetical protein V6D22_13680 [Candidatus Obscuribacterales bacterium]